MGTTGSSGFAINDTIMRGDELISQRNLVTNPFSQAPAIGNWYPDFYISQEANQFNIESETTLADFSAYYPLKGVNNSRAFISIQGVYLTLIPGIEKTILNANSGIMYRVLIAVSLDGKEIKSWYFDTSKGMTFDGRTLRMPEQEIEMTFERKYDKKCGSLFSMSGKIEHKQVRGVSFFNSIPLSQFASTMQDISGQYTLTITKDGLVYFNNQEIVNYEYVPLMYILAGPLPGTTGTQQPVYLISLGYGGTSGISAIVTTDYGTPLAKTIDLHTITPP